MLAKISYLFFYLILQKNHNIEPHNIKVNLGPIKHTQPLVLFLGPMVPKTLKMSSGPTESHSPSVGAEGPPVPHRS